MSINSMRIISAAIAGILIVGMLAACGQIEKAKTLDGSVEPVFSADDEPQAQEEHSVSGDVMIDEVTEELASASEPQTRPNMAEQEQPEQESSNDEVYAERAKTIVDSAAEQLGVPFEMGGDSPEEGFDSTGFTYYCVRQAGIQFPRQLEDQLEFGEKIGYDQMAAGDIVYFSHEVGGEPSFCGVYVGGGMIIYSPTPDDFVKTANITTNYWVTHFVTGLRVTHAEN